MKARGQNIWIKKLKVIYFSDIGYVYLDWPFSEESLQESAHQSKSNSRATNA